jgi:hypothetical protein
MRSVLYQRKVGGLFLPRTSSLQFLWLTLGENDLLSDPWALWNPL